MYELYVVFYISFTSLEFDMSFEKKVRKINQSFKYSEYLKLDPFQLFEQRSRIQTCSFGKKDVPAQKLVVIS